MTTTTTTVVSANKNFVPMVIGCIIAVLFIVGVLLAIIFGVNYTNRSKGYGHLVQEGGGAAVSRTQHNPSGGLLSASYSQETHNSYQQPLPPPITVQQEMHLVGKRRQANVRSYR